MNTINLTAPVESAAQKELREKQERLKEIKAKLAEPGGKFGVGIINAGHSYNKFATHSYDELAKIQKKENKFRKILGLKPNKKPINNLEEGFKPEIDPKILEAGLKKKRSYYAGGKLNMVVVDATNKKKQDLIDKLEKEGKEPTSDQLAEFESDSILKMQEMAKNARKSAIGNAFLVNQGAPTVAIKECKF